MLNDDNKNSSATLSLEKWFDTHQTELLDKFFTFLRFKSVSTDPAFSPDVLSCADWVKQQLQALDFDVQVWPTSGYPTLFASYNKAGPEQPTVLIYHHYDVQPVDPLNEWKSDPFEPTLRDGQIFARGAQDNKGQCFYTLAALRAMKEIFGSYPVNIKLCIEGEEESGSMGLKLILKEKAAELKADYLVVADAGIPSMDCPAVALGVRGIVTLEIEVEGPNGDLHSGTHGGVVMNPIHALAQILSGLRDSETGRVEVPGFYDSIQETSPEDLKQIHLEFDEEKYAKTFGAKPLGGEKGFKPMQRAWMRPTLEVNGISGGYAGAGFKTVLPAKATAKVSCRLVPNQDPDQIYKLVEKAVLALAPVGVKVRVTKYPGGGPALRANVNSPITQAFAKAYSEVFALPCRNIFEGGSIPLTASLGEAAQAEVLFMGLGLPDDAIHGPNEHFGVDRLKKGFLIMARALQLMRNGK